MVRSGLYAAAFETGVAPTLTDGGNPGVVTTDAGDDPAGIEECVEIDRPGEYRLADEITSPKLIPSTDCILITASDVTLDGRGRSMVGSGASDTTAVYVRDATNVTVRDLEVTGWHRAVHYQNVEGGSVENVRVSDNVFGVTFWATEGVSVDDSRISGNFFGIHANGDGVNRLVDTRVAENHVDYDPEWVRERYDPAG